MPYLDAEREYSDAQAVTASAASTNIFDHLGDADRIPQGWLVVTVNTTCTAAGAATVKVDLQTDDNSGFTSATTAHSANGGAVIAKATLVAGYEVMRIRLPQGLERYTRVFYTVATGPLTAGAFDAYVVEDTGQGDHQ